MTCNAKPTNNRIFNIKYQENFKPSLFKFQSPVKKKTNKVNYIISSLIHIVCVIVTLGLSYKCNDNFIDKNTIFILLRIVLAFSCPYFYGSYLIFYYLNNKLSI